MSSGERLVQVPEGLDGERLDAAIARMFGVSRTGAAELIGDGKVLLDGKPTVKSDRVTAGALSPAQPPDPTGLGRRSPHECWVRLVFGSFEARSRRLLSIAKPGRRGIASGIAAVTPRPRSRRPHRSRAGGVLSLDSESLMRVRRLFGQVSLRSQLLDKLTQWLAFLATVLPPCRPKAPSAAFDSYPT